MLSEGFHMTTVAFDGKTLAADACMIVDGRKYRYSGKIKRLKNGCLVGFAGIVSTGQALMEWLETADDNKKPETTEEEDAEAILISPTGNIMFCDRNGGMIWTEDRQAAIGSGGDLALGALLSGATAVQAVQLAIERDPNSGFEVISLDL